MPKFTTFDAPQGTPGPINVRRATATDFGGGQGLDQAGKALQDFAAVLEVKEERKAALYREETLANDRLHFATRLQELKDTLPNGGEGAFEILKQEFEDRSKENGDLMTTNKAKEDYALQMTKLRSRFLSKAVGVEAAAAAFGERKSLTNVLAFNVNAVRADPTDENLQTSIEQITRLVGASRLKGKAGAEFLREGIESLHAARVDGMLSPESVKSSADAEAALARIKTKEFRDALDPKAYDVALGKAQNLVKQYTNEEEQAAIEDFKTRLREEASGLVPIDGTEVTDEELSLAVTDPKKLNAIKDIADTARRLGKFNRVLGTATLEEIPAIQKKLTDALATRGDQDFEMQQQRLLSAMERKLQAEANEEDRKITAGLKEPLEAIAAGVEGAEIKQSTIDRISNPETRAQAQRLKDSAESVRDVKSFAATASETELAEEQAILADALATADDEGEFFAARADLKAFLAAKKTREDRIDKDPSKYAAETHQSVRSAIVKYSEDPTLENFEALADAQIGAQVGTFGIDRRDVHILPADMVSQFKTEKSRVLSEPNAPEQVYELIVRERQRSGKHWPQVMKQMRDAKAFTSTELVVAGMTRPDQIAAAQDLLIAAGLDAQKSFTNLPTGTKSKVGAAVDNETAALSGTLVRGVAGGEVALKEQQDAVHTLAMLYASQGDTPEAAAKRAAKSVVMDNYHFSDTFRVPTGVDLALDIAERATQNAQTRVDFNDVAIPRGFASTEENRRQYADTIRNNGYWATNGDETGLILMAPNGTIVETVGGQPIEMTWDQMRAAGPTPNIEVGAP